MNYGPWPLSGEIDVAEVYRLCNDRAIPFVHYWPGTVGQTNNYCLLKVSDWHTYVLEDDHLDRDQLRRQGVRERDDHAGAAPHGAAALRPPLRLALTHGLGVGGNRLGPAQPPALPATLQIDHVRVWK